MIGQATSHRRRPCQPLVATDQPWQAQALVLGAEIIDATNQVHTRLQGLALPGQRARASGQAVQTTAKGPVDPLDEGRVDVPLALRLLDQLRDRGFCSLINLPAHAHDTIAFVLFEHLRDQNVGPFDEATSSCLLAWLFLAKDLLDDGWITRQAIAAKQQRPAQGRGAAFDAPDQLFDQGAVALRADFPTQPQPGLHHQRHPHPDDGALQLDPQLITLHLAQRQRTLDQLLRHLLSLLAALLKPVLDRALIQTKGEDDGLDGAAVREQFDHQRDLVSTLAQAVKGRPSGVAESLGTRAANVAAVFLRMDADIAFSNLASGRTGGVGTKCGVWGQWRFLFLTHHKENRRLTSDFFKELSDHG